MAAATKPKVKLVIQLTVLDIHVQVYPFRAMCILHATFCSHHTYTMYRQAVVYTCKRNFLTAVILEFCN